MAWYKDWFDTLWYEKLYKKRDDRDALMLLDATASYLPDPGSRIVDLACGRGRHSLNLAARGYQVHGFDLSTRAIHIARIRAEEENLSQVKFHVHDMRQTLPDTYSGLINFFTSFGYFDTDEENAQVLAVMANAVVSGGSVIIDFLNPNFVEKNLISNNTIELDDARVKITRSIDNGRISKTMVFTEYDSGRQHRYKENVALLDLNWFSEHAGKFDLKLDAVMGEYDGSIFDRESSSRQIMIFRKQD
jgi:SAM-dependent methyltransferase